MLLLLPSVCFNGAKTGLLLWFETVLPVLFPFFIVTNLMNRFKITDCINLVLSPVVKKAFHVSKNSTFPILLGFLSGFPVGAKACADEVKNKRITKEEGQYLLSFCNNVSPAFLTGFLSLGILKKPGFMPLIIVDLSAILCAFTYRFFIYKNKNYKNPDKETPAKASKEKAEVKSSPSFPYFIKAFDDSLISSAELLVKIGGYIIIFSIIQNIILSFALKLTDGFHILKLLLVLLSGSMEVTSGISIINNYLTSCPPALSFLSPDTIRTALVLMTASFGGLSAMAQTKSVIMDSGLSMKKYFITRIINAVYAALLSFIFTFAGLL